MIFGKADGVRIAHLTDAHLSALDDHSWWRLRGKSRLGYLSWWRKRRHQLRRDVLDELCAAVAASRPDHIVVTGDLCQLGLADEIEAARAWLAALAEHAPLALVPGNHDCYRADSRPLFEAAWHAYLRPDAATTPGFPSLREMADVVLIGLDSACPSPPWSAAGELGTAQLARLDSLLARTRGRFRCVFLHHPPLPSQTSRRKALRDAPALAALLAEHQVELVLHGHLHRNCCLRHGLRTRVAATAAASCGSGRERAAFRLFDIAAATAGWQVTARLVSLAAPHDLRTLEHVQWQFAPLPAAPLTAGV